MEYIWTGGEWERIEGVRKRTDVPLHARNLWSCGLGNTLVKISAIVRGHLSVFLPPLSSPTLPLFICIPPLHLCTISRDYT
jgi:hypothetical protein